MAEAEEGGDADSGLSVAPCVYSVIYFGDRPPDLLNSDAVCIAKSVSVIGGPVNTLLVGALLVPAMFTGVGELTMGGGTVVLGSYGYVQIGGIVGGMTLNYPTAVWQDFSRLEQLSIMSGWIDMAIQQGSQIVFTNNPALAAEGSGLAYEYQYITQVLGKQIVQSGTSWVVVP